MPANLQDWLRYIEVLHPKAVDLGLERVRQVKDMLGLKPDFLIIMVAGTNGKGSVCAMLERIYSESGYRVGCYTSPHLLTYNERVRVNHHNISDTDLCRAFSAVEAARDDIALTYFEFGTLAAMWHFVRETLDVVVLEVGLGGRLDAVNVFDADCGIVTSIALDHVDYLGSTLDEIGREKSGIYRANTPAICGDVQAPASVVDTAQRLGAFYYQNGRHFSCCKTDTGWIFSSEQHCQLLPMPTLRGDFQLNNAACVVQAVMLLQSRLVVSWSAIMAGLKKVELAGRFQYCHRAPDIILDVAHNPHAARGLADNLRSTATTGKTLAVFAMLADKDIAGVVHELSPLIDIWLIAGIDHARGASVEVLAGYLQQQSYVYRFLSIQAAFAQACLSARKGDRIVAFGSFYTVADVMSAGNALSVFREKPI